MGLQEKALEVEGNAFWAQLDETLYGECCRKPKAKPAKEAQRKEDEGSQSAPVKKTNVAQKDVPKEGTVVAVAAEAPIAVAAEAPVAVAAEAIPAEREKAKKKKKPKKGPGQSGRAGEEDDPREPPKEPKEEALNKKSKKKKKEMQEDPGE